MPMFTYPLRHHFEQQCHFVWQLHLARRILVAFQLICVIGLMIRIEAVAQELPVHGEFVGSGVGVQVIALGADEFELVVYAGGLPGAGWDRSPPQRADGDRNAVRQLIDARQLKPIQRSSPTLGAAPPPSAVILYDGTEASLARWKAGARRSPDGELMAGATTREMFVDYSLHLEFQTPFMPDASGQARGNSGVYHQGRYETQILDSFGLEGQQNEAGGIYGVRAPDLNMCLPPLSWQTYDIDFTAARFDAAGNKRSDARLSVRLNGVMVQNEVPVPGPTAGAILPESNSPGPIYLQDHGNPVRFRNIWIVPRDAERESLRPRVPGYERFFAGVDESDEILGGRMLITQLGCAGCHASHDPLLRPKAGPDLTQVGRRVRLDHLVSFIGQPHLVKGGTTMPQLMHGWSDQERADAVAQLVSFLATTGQPLDRPGDSAAIARGQRLYHSIGCVACHAARNEGSDHGSTSVPLPNLVTKYTLDSLSQFLLDPHAVRVSGLMPKLVNDLAEARDLACYLLGEAIVVPGAEQFNATVYHGSWNKLPDFSQLQPVKRGTTAGLDLSLADRKDNFAMVFEGYLHIEQPGGYRFSLGSDDGSRLLIDDQELIRVDGIHPFQSRRADIQLKAGTHSVRIEYFEQGGEERLEAEIEGPGIGRSPLALLVTASQEVSVKPIIENKFKPAASLIATGQQMFQSLGCAACHKLEINQQALPSTLLAPAMQSLNLQRGCLADQPPRGAPDFALSPAQRRSISRALGSSHSEVSPESHVHLTLASFNCYACHSRGQRGGPEASRDRWFTTSVPEMGNEARIPPPLTGVGDKLRSEVIERIIVGGAKDRPYMRTRMPGFAPTGDRALWATVRDHLVQLDQHALPAKSRAIDGGQRVDIPKAEREAMIVHGRQLVGGTGLACIKCHTYNQRGTPGIQAIDMLTMTERLRPDWFQRYMLAPAEYRPGTRMPLSFPEGRSVLTSVLEGDATRQIQALWLYLSEGSRAKPPTGLEGEAIVLMPEQQPIIYRNFIEGLSPRGIAVGYPQRINLAWDAGTANLALLWKNDFIDASKHWVGRGPGYQGPAGDFVVNLDGGVPLAQLENAAQKWPSARTHFQARELGYRFNGYQLNDRGQPTFHYDAADLKVTDAYQPLAVVSGISPGVSRMLTVESTQSLSGWYWRLARRSLTNSSLTNSSSTDSSVTTKSLTASSDNEFMLNDQLKLQVTGASASIVEVDGASELRLALPDQPRAEITVRYLW